MELAEKLVENAEKLQNVAFKICKVQASSDQSELDPTEFSALCRKVKR